MNQLTPLLFLTFKSLLNGFRRALTTPRRLIALIFFVSYYFFVFVRPALSPGISGEFRPPFAGRIGMPPLELIDSIVFCVFAGFSIFLLAGTLSTQGSFRPADVDVLFATPISPKLVLMFRMVRDYLFTLLMPFLIALFGIWGTRRGWNMLMSSLPHPELAGLALRAMIIAWFLMAMCFVGIEYAASLFVNRSDRRSSRNRAALNWTVACALFATAAFVVWQVRLAPTSATFIRLTHLPLVRIEFFVASFATAMTLAPLQSSPGLELIGVGGLAAITAISFWAAFRQVGWLYDQAAVRGFSSARLRELPRAGDYMGLMAERARAGKLRARKRSWVHGLRMQGAPALLWKELLLQPRTVMALLILLGGTEILVSVLPAMSRSSQAEATNGNTLIAMQALLSFAVTLSLSQTGFLEVLKRIDLQKPLPFPPARIVFFEVLSKAAFGIAASFLGVVAFTAVAPSLWSYGIASVILASCLSVMFSATMFFVTMLFPDVEDPSQRQFRGLMSLLAFAITSLFPGVAMVGLSAVGAPSAGAALAAGVIAVATAVLLSSLAGQFYARFNPSE